MKKDVYLSPEVKILSLCLENVIAQSLGTSGLGTPDLNPIEGEWE